MASSQIVFAIVAVAFFTFGLWLGLRNGKSDKAGQLQQAIENERKLAEAREAGLRSQLEAANAEIAALTPKAFELARVEEQLRNEQEKYAQMKADLDKAFKGAAVDALRANTQSLLDLAKQELGGQTQDAKTALEAREAAIKNLLEPLGKALASLDTQTREMEKSRATAYGEIRTLVEGIGKEIPESLRTLRSETSQLITALRSPKTRGNWGELQLKRCVEYAGMVQYCSFIEQITARDDANNLLRPDMTIQLPNGRTIIVDAKTPLDAFLAEGQGIDPATQAMRFAAHAERVKAHLRDLASKAYWKQFDQTPEFVVCFLPSEALFSAALEADPSLIEFGSQANVVMATPTTLIALLKAVAYGWQQSQVAENAKAIQEAGRDLYGKLVNAHDYFEKMGSALESAVGQYNKFVGAIEGRGGAFSHARRLGELVHDPQILDNLETSDAKARMLVADDWPASSGLMLATEGGESEQVKG